MKEDKVKKFNQLRQQAEKALEKQVEDSQETAVIQRLIHELGVHQIELETQNDELRQTQLQLEESRNQYCSLFNFAPIGYFTLDESGIILEVNLTGANLFGVERKSLIKRGFSRYIAADDQEVFYFHRKKVFETKTKQLCELKLVKKDGIAFYAQLESIIVPNNDGNISQFRTAITDITERKQEEKALRESEERFRQIYAESPIAIELYDGNGQLLDVNQACLDLFGVSEVLEVKGFNLFFDPNVSDEVKKRIRQGKAVRYEASFDFEEIRKLKLFETKRTGIAYLDVLSA